MSRTQYLLTQACVNTDTTHRPPLPANRVCHDPAPHPPASTSRQLTSLKPQAFEDDFTAVTTGETALVFYRGSPSLPRALPPFSLHHVQCSSSWEQTSYVLVAAMVYNHLQISFVPKLYIWKK